MRKISLKVTCTVRKWQSKVGPLSPSPVLSEPRCLSDCLASLRPGWGSWIGEALAHCHMRPLYHHSPPRMSSWVCLFFWLCIVKIFTDFSKRVRQHRFRAVLHPFPLGPSSLRRVLFCAVALLPPLRSPLCSLTWFALRCCLLAPRGLCPSCSPPSVSEEAAEQRWWNKQPCELRHLGQILTPSLRSCAVWAHLIVFAVPLFSVISALESILNTNTYLRLIERNKRPNTYIHRAELSAWHIIIAHLINLFIFIFTFVWWKVVYIRKSHQLFEREMTSTSTKKTLPLGRKQTSSHF